jgi:uncharacterized caspase-like protein
MWKAVFPGLVALVTVGLSLVSGEVIRRETETRQVAALGEAGTPDQPRSRSNERTQVPARDGAQQPGRPVALVIGNAAYPDAGVPLGQPLNNARAVADELRDKGFDVEFGENLARPAMEQAIEAFKNKITPGSVALVFFSGFGIQAHRQTYLVPINAQIWTEDDVKRSGVSLEPILAAADARGAGAKLVILDASRRNPFERRFRSSSAGLAAIQAPNETLVMSAAAPGHVVNDGEGEQSALVGELIAQIRAAGQTAEQAFHHTRVAVSRATGRAQVPWVSSSLVEDVFFAASETTADARQAAE